MGPDHLQAKHKDTAASARINASNFAISLGWPAPVLVDQEGGRVQRLGPPHWPAYPPGARYGELYDRDPAVGLGAARLAGHLIAADLAPLGIDVDCLPLADVPVAGSDPVIGDRAYGTEPEQSCGHRRGDRARTAGGRRLAGAQAPAGPWPRHNRQPSQAAGGRYVARHIGSDRFRRLQAAQRICRSA